MSPLKVTPDLRGCPRGKNSYVRHFKEKHDNLYIVGKLNKCRFRKNINCRFLQFRKRKSQRITEMTMCHRIELIAYPIQVHWHWQSLAIIKSVSAFFDILPGYFFINLSSSSSKECAMGIALKIAMGEML